MKSDDRGWQTKGLSRMKAPAADSQKICSSKEQNVVIGIVRSLSAKNSAARNRAAKAKGWLCVLALGIGVSVGHGQWLETKITLPDSLGGAMYPCCLTTDTSERYVYIGAQGYFDQGGGIYVVDAEARSRVAKIPSVSISAVCSNTRRNKVYAADSARNRVLAISCATNQVVATVSTGATPLALCYNSVDDKVYAVNYDSDDLTVIDCLLDSVIRTIHTGDRPVSICYNPASNRVFCAAHDTLLVIDGASDSIVAVRAGEWIEPLVVNVPANRVYAHNLGVGLMVLDGATGVVLDTIIGCGPWLCLNSRTQKLYTYDNNEVRIFDCATDTLVKKFRLHQVYVFSMACDTAADKVYVSCQWGGDAIVVIDGVIDTIAIRMPGPNGGVLLASSKRGRMYSTDRYGPELVVFDTSNDSLLRTIMIGGTAYTMCYDSVDDKVYYATYSVLGEAGSIDAATNQLVGHVQVGSCPQSIMWHAPTNRVYCSGVNLTVIDPTADTVTKILPGMYGLLCSAPSVNKVYAYAYADHELAVIDCRDDSVTKRIPIPTYGARSMCYVAYNKLYVGGYDAASIVDCVADTLIRSYPFGFSRFVRGREGKRVYCWRPDALCTFDTAGDTLVAEAPWEAGSAQDLLYVPGVNKVYCADPSGEPQCGQGCVLVADGTTDSLITQVPVRMAWALGYDSANGLVYCSHGWDSAVTFIAGRTDSVVGSLNLGVWATEFVTVPAHSRVYVGGDGNPFIPVIRTDPPGVEETALTLSPRAPTIPTIVSRSTSLVIRQPSVLLDAAGRKVLDMRTGQHGLTGCRAGIYFLRSRTDGTIVKILLVD